VTSELGLDAARMHGRGADAVGLGGGRPSFGDRQKSDSAALSMFVAQGLLAELEALDVHPS
jgi:hypothetical protein